MQVRFQNGRSGQTIPHSFGHSDRAGMVANVIELTIEIGIGTQAGIDREGSDVSGVSEQTVGFFKQDDAIRGHEVGPIDQGQSLFGCKFEWRQTNAFEGVLAGDGAVLIMHLAFN